LFLQIKDNYLY